MTTERVTTHRLRVTDLDQLDTTIEAQGHVLPLCYMVERVGVRELRQNLSRWLQRVENGESFEVTDRGRPVAQLIPLSTGDDVIDRLVRAGRIAKVGRGSLADLPPPRPRREDEPSISDVLQELREDKIQLISHLLYADASALVKLFQAEHESNALREELRRWPRQGSSVLGEIELRRAGRRFRASGAAIDAIVANLSLVPVDEDVRLLAATVGSPSLRSLDAIHLATALSLGDDLGAFCCYDRRLIADAEAAGLTVVSPGLD